MASANLDGVEAEKRRELKISGENLTKGLKDESIALSSICARFTALNFLELSESSLLVSLPDELARLSSLTNLVLQGNQLEKLPDSIGDLKKLKFLDASRNVLLELPSTIGGCAALETLNVSNNRLSALPSSLISCERLSHVDGSRNNFDRFPQSIVNKKLQHLAEISLKSNRIEDIPVNISELVALRSMDLSENKIRVVPGELGDCSKLKELQLRGNELSDRRLRKLIDDGVQKSILDYVKKNCPKAKKAVAAKKQKSTSGSGQDEDQAQDEEVEVVRRKDKIIVSPSRWELSIEWRQIVADVRPHALFCVVKDVDLSDQKVLKEFLGLQTKLHESLCQRRVAATIASHDLSKIEFPIFYTAKAPGDIMVHALGRSNECSAAELVSKLTAEAEQLRKEKKRQVYSGVHQYLYLVKDKPKYACLVDTSDRMISFPPITNSDLTKVSTTTKELLLEVTSDKDAATCKRVMEALLKGIFASPMIKTIDHIDGAQYKSMLIEQIKVTNEDDTLKVAYPSKIDLTEFGDHIEIIRTWEKVDSQ